MQDVGCEDRVGVGLVFGVGRVGEEARHLSGFADSDCWRWLFLLAVVRYPGIDELDSSHINTWIAVDSYVWYQIDLLPLS